jgi:hypothetical protein
VGNLNDDLSPCALSGCKKLVNYFIVAARIDGRSFVAGPVWNTADNLIPGDKQYLRFSFRDVEPAEIPFTTADLKKYGNGHALTALLFEKQIHSILDAKAP